MDRVRRQRRRQRIRARLTGAAQRPRVAVYRSNRYVWVQLVDDGAGRTLAAASGKQFAAVRKVEQAKLVGQAVAEVAKASGITSVVFDRSGYRYHGRVKAIADALRESGISV